MNFKKRNIHPHHCFSIIAITGIAVIVLLAGQIKKTDIVFAGLADRLAASVIGAVPSPWHYQFSVNGTLSETSDTSLSTSPYWWLNSGGYMTLQNGMGSTYVGDLPANNKWAIRYKKSSSVDTDGGMHPQNLFRLVTRNKWQNYTQEAYFNTLKLNLSTSDQRNAWSGMLLFNRYQDGDNLYYAGLRDDGTAVVKSKKNGVYKTLAQQVVFPGTYNRNTNPSLLPLNQWIGIKTEVKTLPDNTVSIKLYTDIGKTGTWTLRLSTIDAVNPILNTGYAGIRTDFRDVQFDDFKVVKL